MKKIISLLIILTMIVVLFPLTALASPAEPQKPADITNKKPIDISKFGNFPETDLGQPDGVNAMDAGTVGPTENTIAMHYYDDDLGGYYNGFEYIAKSTGFYSFYSLTTYDTDIYVIDRKAKKLVDYDDLTGTPFCAWIYMTKGTKYDILIFNNTNSSSVTFLMTTPATLGSTTCTMSPNGLSKSWTQALDFNVSKAGNYSIHIAGLSDSTFGWYFWSGTSYKNFKSVDYTSSLISHECYHTFSLKKGSYHLLLILHNSSSTTSPFTISVDNNSPVITAKAGTKAVKANSSVKTSVTTSVSDTTLNEGSMTVTVNGGAPGKWTNGEVFTAEGSYVLSASDYFNNTSTFKFNIDLTPVISATVDAGASQLKNNDITGKQVHVAYSDMFIKSKALTLNGKKSAWPDTTGSGSFDLTKDGVYSITLKDKIGNSASLKFTEDRTAPVITATPLKGKALPDGGFTNKASVTVKITDLTAIVNSVTKDGAAFAYPSKGKFTAEGKYVITATDKAGNTSTFTFTIDRRALSIAAQDKGGNALTSGASTNSDVTVTVTGNSIAPAATKNSASYTYPVSGVFTEEGTYVVTATGYTGNVSTFTFTINKTAPTITAQDKDGGTVSDNGYSNKEYVTVTIGATATTWGAKKNGTDYTYPAGGKFTEEGTYIVTATDKEGNSRLFHFTIDRTAPVVSASDSSGSISDNGSTNKDVTVTVGTDTVAKHATKGGTAYTYPSDGKFTEEGVYVIYADDSLGNEAVFHFTIDKTGPSITAANSDGAVSNNGYSDKNVTVTVGSDSGSPSAKKDDVTYTYPSGGVFTEDGVYKISASDSLGNVSTYTFTIDKTDPVITAVDDSINDVDMNAVVYSSVDISVTEVNIDSITITKDGSDYYKYPEDSSVWDSTGHFNLSHVGAYVITVIDKAKNEVTLSFTISTP